MRISRSTVPALLAAGILALSCTAVAFAEGAKEEPSGPVKLVMWTHEDPNRSVLEKGYIEQFKAANPNMDVEYVTYPSGKIKDIVVAGFAANQGPDIFNLEINDAYPFISNGRVAPVDPKSAGYASVKAIQDAYVQGMLKPVTEDGQIYGLPLELTNWCLFLNKKIFRDAGLDPEKDAPKTWEDILAVSEKMVKRNGEIILRRGFDFRYPYYLISWVPMVEQLGGKLVSDDGKTAIVNDAAWLKVLNYMKDFGPSGKNLGSPTYAAARKLFDNDKDEIALSLSGLYQEPRMKSANPAFFASSDWSIIPFPQWKDAVATVPNNYYGHYYMVNAQKPTASKNAAWKLVSFMLSHGEEYLSKVGLVQPTVALMNSATFKALPYSDVFKKDLEKAHIVYYGANSPKIDSLLKTAVESVMLSGVSPEKALSDLRSSVQSVLDEE